MSTCGIIEQSIYYLYMHNSAKQQCNIWILNKSNFTAGLTKPVDNGNVYCQESGGGACDSGSGRTDGRAGIVGMSHL